MSARSLAVVNRLGRTVRVSIESGPNKLEITVEPSDAVSDEDVIDDGYSLAVGLGPETLVGWRQGEPLAPFVKLFSGIGKSVVIKEGWHRRLRIPLLLLSLDERTLN